MTDDNITLNELAQQMRTNSERWFPNLHADPPVPLVTFYALGLAGEAGEVANLVKKGLRVNDLAPANLGDELADVFTYLLLLADECGVNLLAEFEAKAVVCEERWG